MSAKATSVPTESQEQQALFRWAGVSRTKYPELGLMFHIPNEGQRNPRTGYRLKTEGMKRGVPDVCLPVARGGYHGLYVEMKRTKGGVASDEQKAWLNALRKEGYAAFVCFGWVDAAAKITAYLQKCL